MHVPCGQLNGFVMAVMTAMPDDVRMFFLRSLDSNSLRSSGSRYSRISEFFGTLSRPNSLQTSSLICQIALSLNMDLLSSIAEILLAISLTALVEDKFRDDNNQLLFVGG